MKRKRIRVPLVIVVLALLFAGFAKAEAQAAPFLTRQPNNSVVNEGVTVCAVDPSGFQLQFYFFAPGYSMASGFMSFVGAGVEVCTSAPTNMPLGVISWYVRNSSGVPSSVWFFSVQGVAFQPFTPVTPLFNTSGGIPIVGPNVVSPGLSPFQAQKPGVPGAVDLIRACTPFGYIDAGNVDGTLTGWFCTRPDGSRWFVNWNQVCFSVYGSNFIAEPADNTQAGWRCVQIIQPQQVPLAFCSPFPTRLTVGSVALNTSGVSLSARNFPSTGSTGLFLVPNGAEITINGGPFCGESKTWWYISFNGMNGWLPEVNTIVYNLSPAQ